MKISKKMFLLTTLSFTCAAVCAFYATTQSGGVFARVRANEVIKAKHFAAVMPTETTQGIREYWTDCVGGNPVFENPGYATEDAVLSDAQVAAILADQNDERIIPTLERIQNAVSKGADGTSAYDLTFVRDAYAYKYLDAATKALVTGAVEANIENALATFNSTFTVVFDAAKDLLPIVEQTGVSVAKGYDVSYGDVVEITTELGSAGGTSQLYFYGLNRNGVTYGTSDTLNFAVYSPFAAAANTSQTYWVGAYGTAKKFSANAQAWTSIAATGTELNSDGKCATSLGQAISLQRYVNGTIDPYTGTYKLSSIVAEKELTEEGSVMLRGKNNITDIHTWGEAAGTTEITYGVNTPYGQATQVDIKAKSSVVELQWNSASIKGLSNFDYARMYVYAKTTQRVYVSLSDWRNNVVNIPGVAPFADDNGTQANNVQSAANVVADQWNIIDIPTSYLAQDTDSKIYIEIWADQNVAADGWLFSDLLGHNGEQVVDNGGQLIAHNTSATVTATSDADLGACSRVTLNAASGFAKQNGARNIAGFTTIEFNVKNEASADMKFLLYMVASGVYGNSVKGSYLQVTVAAGATQKVEINIAEYFGTNASSSLIMLRVDGAIGNSMLIGRISCK